MTKKIRTIISLSVSLAIMVILVIVALRTNPSSMTQPQESLSSDNKQRSTDKKSTKASPRTKSTNSIRHSSNQNKPSSEEQLSHTGTSFQAKNGATFPIRRYKTLGSSDPLASQWWTQRTGLLAAWDRQPSSSDTVVAIIDTGFALNHEEFSGRWAQNEGESGTTTTEAASKRNCTDQNITLNQSCNLIDDDYDTIVDNEAGPTSTQNPSQLNCTDQLRALDKACNLIDDDNNGYVDDERGWDFANYDNSAQAGQTNPNGGSTTHGTMVAGILGASGTNGRGIAGVNWSAQILPLQAIDDDGYGDTLTVSRAIRYATDRNADIISLSLGSDLADDYLRLAVQYALDKGTLVVAASGNDGCDCMVYPARYPETFAVGAESEAGGRASFSSYGASLDIIGPGENMTTSSWSTTAQSSAYASGVAGTSFATPYVSGLLAHAKALYPKNSWAELTQTLAAKARHTGLSQSAPFTVQLGSGFASADTFLQRLSSPASPTMRYYFGSVSTNTPLSGQIYQCETNDFPTALLYEMTKNSVTRYTISPLEQVRQAGNGWTIKPLWRSCVGLSSDTPTRSRTINLLSEIKNQPIPKSNY